MSPKIQSKSGEALADIYSVEGSIAGIEELHSREVSLYHEMGAEIFSERLRSYLIQLDSTAVNQSTAWNITASGVPDVVNRVLGVTVLSNAASRVDYCSVGLIYPADDTDLPLYVFDSTHDDSARTRWVLNGAAVAARWTQRPRSAINVPQLITRMGDEGQMPSLVFRGISTAFGAGTVQAWALVHLARAARGSPAPGEPRGHGLTFPSW